MRILDTLEYVRRLQGAGISREHAEAHATVMAERILSEVATRADIEQAVDQLRQEIERVQDRITIRLGALIVVTVGALAALQKLT
ncbi:MAG: hypothetical protein FJX65_18760 [Alphaproteobacteria bacterium]|nr:hypothetical protein [Alphaproteobacteria bacterium]